MNEMIAWHSARMITVVTPTIPARAQLLQRCRGSVQNQDGPQFADHLIKMDISGRGPGQIRNELVAQALTEWVLFLDDDDTVLPNYTQVVQPVLCSVPANVAVVYTAWSVVGDLAPQPLLKFHPELIHAGRNHVPVTACVRVAHFLNVGGFQDADELEDLGLWQRILRHSLEFAFVPVETWKYHRDHTDSRNRETVFGSGACTRCGCPGCGKEGDKH